MSHDTLTDSSAQARIAALLSSGLDPIAIVIGVALLHNPGVGLSELETLTKASRRTVFRYKAQLQAWESQSKGGATGDTHSATHDTLSTRPVSPMALAVSPVALEQRSESPPIYPPSTTSTDRNNLVDRCSNIRNNFWANLNPDYNQASQAVWWDDLGRLQVANGFRAELITTVGGEANLRQALDEAAAYVETRFVGLDLMKRVRGRITQQLRWKAEQQKRHPVTETQAERMARVKAAFDAAPATKSWS